MMMLSIYFLLILRFCQSEDTDPVPSTTEQTTEEAEKLVENRRIMGGTPVYDTRPYMAYLRPARLDHVDYNWLCGGVIIGENYVLTSAACIEDIERFYVVVGTHRWLPASQTNECIENGAMRAIWKCVPRTYRYDGTYFNNIRWMVNDIAVVMTEDTISFTKRVKGCDFIPSKIDFNNYTRDWEQAGTKAFVAGWGSVNFFTDVAVCTRDPWVVLIVQQNWQPYCLLEDLTPMDVTGTSSHNSPVLMEAKTVIINKNNCQQRWLPRYHSIIEKYMICGKQASWSQTSPHCEDNHADCRQLVFSEEVGPRTRRLERDPEKLLMDSAAQVRKMEKARKEKVKTRRFEGNILPGYGGFCENDHGGPLIVGRGKSAIVVGVASAYRVQNDSRNCRGPFLYTSVYDNRFLIQCAMFREIDPECRAVLRDSSTVLEEEKFDWGKTPFRSRAVYDEDHAPVLRSATDVADPPTSTNDTLDDKRNNLNQTIVQP